MATYPRFMVDLHDSQRCQTSRVASVEGDMSSSNSTLNNSEGSVQALGGEFADDEGVEPTSDGCVSLERLGL